MVDRQAFMPAQTVYAVRFFGPHLFLSQLVAAFADSPSLPLLLLLSPPLLLLLLLRQVVPTSTAALVSTSQMRDWMTETTGGGVDIWVGGGVTNWAGVRTIRLVALAGGASMVVS